MTQTSIGRACGRLSELERLEERVCMSAAADAAAPVTIVGVQSGTLTINELVGSGNEVVRVSNGEGWLLVITYKNPSVPTRTDRTAQGDGAKAGSDEPKAPEESDPVVVKPNDAASSRSGGPSLAAHVEAAVQGEDAPAAGFIAPAVTKTSDAGPRAVNQSASVSEPIATISPFADGLAGAATGAAFALTAGADFIKLSTQVTQAAGRVASALTSAAVGPSAEATAVAAAAAEQIFSHVPLVLPQILLTDSIAAFVEESASVSTALATGTRAQSPWPLTFAVLAADVVALAYIHRRAFRRHRADSVFARQ